MLKFLPIFIRASRWIIGRVEPVTNQQVDAKRTALSALDYLQKAYNTLRQEGDK